MHELHLRVVWELRRGDHFGPESGQDEYVSAMQRYGFEFQAFSAGLEVK